MIIEVSSSMISGNGGVVQSITDAAGLTFIYGNANGGLITQPRAGFLRGRQGSTCKVSVKLGLVVSAWVLYIAVRKSRLTSEFSRGELHLLS